MIVIDTSALLEVLLNTSASGKVAERLFAGSDTFHARMCSISKLPARASGHRARIELIR